MSTRRIPLFPLHTALFPGMSLPLHVFEPRYQELVRRCLEADRLFGVCLIRSGEEVGGPAEPYAVGTTCEILSVTPLGNGRMHLSTVGRETFRVLRLFHERPYTEAEIEVLPPGAPGVPGDLPERVRECAARYIRGLLVLHGEPDTSFDLPTDPYVLSCLVGSVLQVPLAVRQELLETGIVEERLRRELELLEAALHEQDALLRERARIVRPFAVPRGGLSPN
jgi:Lon protease-like protein